MALATEMESCREFARNVGRDEPARAWILTPQDCWIANPFYHGPAVRHPEDDYPDADQWEAESDTPYTPLDEIPF
jgi:hypothetical protein